MFSASGGSPPQLLANKVEEWLRILFFFSFHRIVRPVLVVVM